MLARRLQGQYIMSNETTSSFPASQQDISNLKQTATDAVNDLGNTASDHANKAKDQLRDLAGHVQEEGCDQMEKARAALNDLADSARSYAARRPFACIGIALVFGFLAGLSRRRSRRN